MKRKLLAVLVGVVLLMTCIPLGAVSVSAYAWYGNYCYETSGSNATIIYCDPSAGSSITVPSTLNGYTVTSIGYGAFSGYHGLQSITLPGTVTKIDERAFEACSGLQSITVPDSVTSIGYMAFNRCTSLTEIAIGKNVTNIGDFAFGDCTSLTEVDFGEQLTTINMYAFYNCSALKKVTLPSTVRRIYTCAFANCSSLTDVYYDGTQSDRYSIYIESYNTDLTYATWHYPPTMPSEVWYTISGGEVTINNCNFALSGVFEIPSKVDGYPVTTIADGAFNSCMYLTKIIIPDTVTYIGEGAFIGCDALTSIEFGDGATVLGPYAFTYCYKLTDVDFGNGMTTIGDYAFYGCTGLTTLNLPVNITTIGYHSFYGCSNLRTVNYGGSRTDRNNMFIDYYNSDLTNATWNYAGCDHYYTYSTTTQATCISNGVRTYTCYYCGDSYTEIIYATGIHTYTNACDSYCNICGSWRNAPHSYKYVCDNYCQLCYAWRSTTHSYDNACDTVCNVCGLWRATTHVYDNACDTVCNVCGLWRETTHVYDNACDTTCNICGNIREANDHTIIFVGGNDATCTTDGESHWCCTICGFSYVEVIPATGNHVYDNDRDDTCNVCGYVRVGCEDDYHTYVGDWDAVCALCGYVRYLTYTINGDEVTITGYTDDLPAELVIPDTIDGYPVTTIGRAAFSEALTLTSITLPDSVTVIEEFAFNECWNLSDVSLGSRLTKIGYRAFDTCYTLTSIDLPNSITDICGGAFIGCNALISITIPTGVDEISVSTFSGCSSLISVTIPNSVTAINEEAFANCWSLTEVVIPDSVTYIGERAFGDCYSLTEIVIPSSVTTIKSNTFSMCDHLSAIIVDDANPFYSSVDGVLFNKDQTHLLLYPAAKPGSSYVIPDGVTHIGDAAFYSCPNLSSIAIPVSIVEIIEAGMSIANLSDVYYAGTQAQSESIIINPGNAALHNATWHYNAGIYNGMIYTLENEEITIVGHTDNLPAELVIPDTINGYPVTAIGVEAFSMCAYLTSVTIPDSVTRIGHWAFGACSGLTSITIPNSVITINEGAFTACWNLTTITIPDSVTKIDDDAFSGCSSLVDLYLGSSIANIGLSAFDSCISLSHVYYNGSAADREKVFIGYGNDPLHNATWYYAACDHIYDNDCDADCNVCGDIREVGDHLYDYYVTVEATCGTEGELTWLCLCCGVSYTETIPATGDHVYDDDHDADCNVCGAVREVQISIPGDINDDGKINNRDLAALQQHLNEWDVTINMAAADVDGSGKLNNRDLALLQQYLNEWDVVLK